MDASLELLDALETEHGLDNRRGAARILRLCLTAKPTDIFSAIYGVQVFLPIQLAVYVLAQKGATVKHRPVQEGDGHVMWKGGLHPLAPGCIPDRDPLLRCGKWLLDAGLMPPRKIKLLQEHAEIPPACNINCTFAITTAEEPLPNSTKGYPKASGLFDAGLTAHSRSEVSFLELLRVWAVDEKERTEPLKQPATFSGAQRAWIAAGIPNSNKQPETKGHRSFPNCRYRSNVLDRWPRWNQAGPS